MSRYRLPAALCAAAASLCVSLPAHATPAALVTGQTLSLPLTDDSDGPNLKLTVTSAMFRGGGAYRGVPPVEGETRDERKARGEQMVLDDLDGRNLVKFVRFVADDLRGHYAAANAPVAVSATFDDHLKLNGGALAGDALKAGLTLGFGQSATTGMIFVAHMELTVNGPGGSTVLSCDAEERGRVPSPPSGLVAYMLWKDQDHSHDRDELNRMEEVARKACYAQIAAKLGAEAPAPAAPTAAPTPPAPAADPAAPATSPAPAAVPAAAAAPTRG